MPPSMAGRDELLEQFDGLLDRTIAGYPTEVPVLLGERGVGKTVLLNAWARRARERGWAAHRFQAEPDRPLEAKVAAEVQALVASMSRGPKRRAGSTTAEAELNVGIGRVSVSRKGADPAAPVTIEESARALARAAHQSRVGVVLLFDELHDATDIDLRRLGNLFQFVASEELPIVIGGAGLLSLREHVPSVGASTFTERAWWIEIGNLSPQDTERVERVGRSAASVDKVRRVLIDQDLLSNAARGTVTFTLPFYGAYALTRAQHEVPPESEAADKELESPVRRRRQSPSES